MIHLFIPCHTINRTTKEISINQNIISFTGEYLAIYIYFVDYSNYRIDLIWCSDQSCIFFEGGVISNRMIILFKSEASLSRGFIH